MKEKLKKFKVLLQEVYNLEMANYLLNWDQSTYMPPGGATARSRQGATLARLAQEKFIDPAIGKLLDELQPYEESLPYDSDDAALIRVTRREYERAIKVPPEFLANFNEHTIIAYQVWKEARPANDFSMIQPYLEKSLDLSRQLANFFPGYEHIADPLIDFADHGMRVSTIRKLFTELRQQLVPIVQALTAQEPIDDSCLHQHFPELQQIKFSEEVIRQLGYDFRRGRMDKSPHPFTTKFSLGDVRITTRVKEDFLGECLFSAIHEFGHATYEQGIRTEFEGTPLANGASSGVHESQSRTWENLVGRSREFWEFFYPRLLQVFPDQLDSVPLETFYYAINRVERSLIRTDADEVTYNLHVMLRFDLELQLLEDKLAIKDLPEAWREHFKADIGIPVPNDKDGVLQDVHWYSGTIGGAFQGYTLGNILGALFFESALKTHPEIRSKIRQGEFSLLRNWLGENLYQHGNKFTALELVERITGGSIRIEPYIQYLKTKYSEIYQL